MQMQNRNNTDILDHIKMMKAKEEKTYRCRDYLKNNAEMLDNTFNDNIDGSCRAQMCSWCFQVIDNCKFQRETAAIAILNLDRFMSTPKGSILLASRREYQLAAMSSLYTAIKIHEPTMLETSILASLSQGTYTESEFTDMEKVILDELEWRVNGPTSFSFVESFISLMLNCIDPSVACIIRDIARRQIELAIGEYKFIECLPSSIALASFLNAMSEVDVELLPIEIQNQFINFIERSSCEFSVCDIKNTQKLLSLLYMGFTCEDDIMLIEKPIYQEDLEDFCESMMITSEDSHYFSPVSAVK